jgi:F0F1-type ATP synthase delta subunit
MKLRMRIEKNTNRADVWLGDKIIYVLYTGDFTDEKLNRIVQKLEKYLGREIEVVEKEENK